MYKLRDYLNNISMRRVIVMLLGVVLTGWGIATFRLAALGTDPYSGMNLALADFLGIPYPTLQILVNIGFFIIQLLWGRALLGRVLLQTHSDLPMSCLSSTPSTRNTYRRLKDCRSGF